MKQKRATAIVLELAEANILTDDQVGNDPQMKREREKQLRALEIVRSLLLVG